MQWLSQMERENALWEIRLVRLSKRIDRMNGMLGPLEEFNLNLKDRVGIESTEGPAPLKGMGGSDSFLWLKDYHISGNPELLVQLMHRSLDTISKETAVLRHDRIQLHSFLKKQNEVLAAVRPQLPKDARLPLSTHPLAMPIPDKAKSLQILAMDPE
jgi:hypothetical protein